MWIDRNLESKIIQLSETRPAILITGARQVGKSSLLKKAFPLAEYVTLDRVATADFAEQNPSSFLRNFKGPVIIDEIQYAPSLFRELKILIDEERDIFGKWILTGSQKFTLMKNISESLAGRVGIIPLSTLCLKELQSQGIKDSSDIVWKGGFPELWAHAQIDMENFFDTYVQTYLERDLQAIIKVNSIRDFQRFMRACAIRVGQLINFSDIAKDVGVSQVTIKSWIEALEASNLVTLLSPYYRNLGKRLVKAPKLYFNDTGLLCYLLDIFSSADYKSHIYRANIWENFVLSELTKSQGYTVNKNLFFYRDQNGVEIDFLLEKKSQIYLVEVKDSEKVDPRKLNFKKVTPLFKEETHCSVACHTEGDTIYRLKDWSLFNPIFCKKWP